MRVRALDSLHDWQFGKGQNDYARDQKAIIQNIDTRLNSFLGDCFFDEGAGIDWFNLLGSKDQLTLNLAIASVILNTEGVIALQRLFIDLDVVRALTIRYQVQTTFSSLASSIFINVSELG